MPHAARLEPPSARAVLDDYGWELYNAAPLPRGGRRRQRRGRLYASLGDPVALALCLVRAVAPPVHGRRDRRGRGVRRSARCGCSRRPATTPALAHATLYLRRDPGPDRRPRARPEPCSRAPTRWRCARSAGPRRAGLNYLGDRARRGAATRTGSTQCATASRSRIAGRHHEDGRARLLQPRRAAAARRAPGRARALRAPKGWPSPASAASGRTPTTSRCTAACCCSAAATGTAPRRGCARSSRPSTTRACCSPTACRGWAACWPGAATPPPGGCSPRVAAARSASGCCSALAYAGIARVEWAWLAGRARRRRAGRGGAAAAHRASGRGAVPRRAAALPRARGPAGGAVRGLPARGRPGSRATGARPPRLAAAGDPYETALELAESGDAERDARGPARCSTACGADPAAAARARSACARWARASRAARARPRAPTRPGSRRASSRSSACCARA